MAEQAEKDASERAIRNVQAYSGNEQFERENIEQITSRRNHLSTTWNRFACNHVKLLQLAAANQPAYDELNKIYDEVELIYLQVGAKLRTRLEELNRLNAQNAAAAPNPNVNLAQGNAADNNTEQEQRRAQQIDPAQLQQQLQPIIVQLNNARPVENTWGEFSGDLTQWQGFHDRFKSAVHDSDMSNAFKFQHLKQSLKGKAAMAIGEWQLTDNNYGEAWERLKQLYSRPYQTCKELLWKFQALPKLDKASGGMIQKFSNITHEVMRSLRAMEFPVEHLDIMFVHGLHDRLDHDTNIAWELQRRSENPTTMEMLDFLDRQAKALMGVQFVEQKGQPDNKKRSSFNRNDKHEHKRAKNDKISSSSTEKSVDFRLCKVCKENHPLHRCPKFVKMTLAERKKCVREHELCHNCLRPSHFSKDCFAKPCLRCNVKHNSLLCPENPFNNKVVTTVQVKPNTKKTNAKKAKNESEKSE